MRAATWPFESVLRFRLRLEWRSNSCREISKWFNALQLRSTVFIPFSVRSTPARTLDAHWSPAVEQMVANLSRVSVVSAGTWVAQQTWRRRRCIPRKYTLPHRFLPTTGSSSVQVSRPVAAQRCVQRGDGPGHMMVQFLVLRVASDDDSMFVFDCSIFRNKNTLWIVMVRRLSCQGGGLRFLWRFIFSPHRLDSHGVA